jgi:hypothetical protein
MQKSVNFYDEKERIQREMSNLRIDLSADNYKINLAKLKALDKELSELNLHQLLKDINAEQERKRNFALQAWKCEEPTEDPTNADGSFHKTKIKKFPILAALQYGRAKWKDGVMKEINVNGHKFDMCQTICESGKPDQYKRPETFKDFLILNHIMPEPLTMEQYKKLKEEMEKANAEIDEAIKKYDQKRKELKTNSFQSWGLIEQRNTHFYKYEVKTKN